VTVLTDLVRDVVTSGRLAHLVTINQDGSPQLTVVWIDVEGDELVTGHFGRHQKVRNVARDPRVILSMETGSRNAMGLDEYLVIEGTARLEAGGAPQLIRRLARRYMGAAADSQRWLDDPPAGYLLRITPERISGVGPWGRAY
jgi:PPOX class probable F420-dependent enzyme